MKKIIFFSALFFLASAIYSQEAIVVRSEFKKSLPYNYNSEWHYLSTDLYLFNSAQFQVLLNELYLTKKKKKDYDKLSDILVTAKIDGTALGNISYPVFNFSVDNSQSEIKTSASDTKEAVRLIDNLPLSSATGNFIDAQINIDVITEKKESNFFDFVTDQLDLIANYTTPIEAAKTLTGEFSALIKAKNKSKEYKFNSTVRLYEEHDFNKRVCSVSIYSFVPATLQSSGVDSCKIAAFLDSIDNPSLDYIKLQNLVNFTKYPFMVIVNYKSKYVSEPVVGDEVTFESVETRAQRLKKSYESDLLSKDIYVQEVKLVEFLQQFVTLKSCISNYQLNYKNRITDDYSRMFLMIITEFRSLKNMYLSRLKEFGGDAVFNNEFLTTYKSILLNADVYMDADNNLKNLKNITGILLDEINESTEKKLEILHSVQFPTDRPDSEILTSISSLIKSLETGLYIKEFSPKTDKLNLLSPSAEATSLCEDIKSQINSTYCTMCKQKAGIVVNSYMQRLEGENKRKAEAEYKDAQDKAGEILYYVLKKESALNKGFAAYSPDSMPPDIKYLYDEFLKLKLQRENFQNTLKNKSEYETYTQTLAIAEDLRSSAETLKSAADAICEKNPQLCE